MSPTTAGRSDAVALIKTSLNGLLYGHLAIQQYISALLRSCHVESFVRRDSR
jgi:ADP-ribosylglycohydrolase